MVAKSNGIVTNAKTIYSVEDGVSYRSSPLKVDPLTNGISMWEAIDGGDAIGIDHGKLDINLSASIFALTGSTDINSRTQGIYVTYIPRLMADLNLTDVQAAAIFGNAAYESGSFNDLVEGPFSNYTDPN